MESGGSNMGRGRPKKTDKCRRAWTSPEEDVLIASLKELISIGWKTDNGFRVGYLGKLEGMMQKAFPGIDLKGQPHINSKIVGWKRTYSIVSTALTRTGVGFNDTTNMLDCTDETWDLVVKNDPTAHNMRRKSFPLFKVWVDLFGKDRATGEQAEDVMEAVNNLINEDNLAEKRLDGDYHVDLEGLFEEEDGNSVCQNGKPTQRSKIGGQKRKSHDGVEGLYEIVGKLVSNTEEKMDTIARYIGYEYGLGEKRKQLFELLSNIPGLTMDEKLDVSEILAEKVDLLEMFTGLPEDARERYVRRLLGKKKA